MGRGYKCSKPSTTRCWQILLWFVVIAGALLSVTLWSQEKSLETTRKRKPASSVLEKFRTRPKTANAASTDNPASLGRGFISEEAARARFSDADVSDRAKALVDRQLRVFAKDGRATKDLESIRNGRSQPRASVKRNLYAWWVFPTNWSGATELFKLPEGCEPNLSLINSGVESADDAHYVLKHNHVQWTSFLKQFCDTCNDPKFGSRVYPPRDPTAYALWVLGEVDYKKAQLFWQFWLEDSSYRFYKGIQGIGAVTKLYPEFHKQVLRIKKLCPTE